MNRRRFLSLTAATSALALTGAMSRPAQAITWQGVALGANASLTLMVDDKAFGQKVLSESMKELQRLENIFSIYEPGSELSRLNKAGFLDTPSHEFLELLSLVQDLHQRTDGLFDPTVQPLYQLHRAHGGQPPKHLVDRVTAITGFEKVSLKSSRISYGDHGMAMTMNGIAQGYITDKIAAHLKRAGFNNLLLNLGEVRAEGRRHRHQPWRVAIGEPQNAARYIFETDLENRAVATSAASGLTYFIDPRAGRAATQYASLSVLANSAALADGLSTALSLTTWPETQRLARGFANTAIVAQLKSGKTARYKV